MKQLKVIIPIAICIMGLAQSAKGETGLPSQEMAILLAELAALSPRPFHILRVSEARRQPTMADAVTSLLAKSKRIPDLSGIERTFDITLRTPPTDLPARVYRPIGSGFLPVILYFHGGGWVISDIDSYEMTAAALARRTGAIVVSVEYRRGPEEKFPAAHNDAFNAYKWALQNSDSIGGDSKLIAVAGENAGGNLAINVAIRARDEKLPLPRHILAVSPIADGSANTASYHEMANAKPLSRSKMTWYFAQYFSIPSEALDPRISLLRADLKKLPPTTIMTAEIDPLRSEGQMLYQRMKDLGVPIEYRFYEGVTHEFFGAADVLTEARAAQAYAAARIRASFRSTF